MLLLQAVELLLVVLNLQLLRIQRILELVKLDDVVDPPNHVPHSIRYLRYVIECPFLILIDSSSGLMDVGLSRTDVF